MRIRDSYRKLSLEHPLTLSKNHPLRIRSSGHSQSFKEEFDSSRKKELSQKLRLLLLEIDEQGKKLAKARTHDILSQYRELIKSFLKEVVENLYLLGENKHFDSKGRQKVLIQVKSINKALEDLTKMVLDKENDNLKVLEKVGEIKGMLIDLYS